jgi:hypothetical protein
LQQSTTEHRPAGSQKVSTPKRRAKNASNDISARDLEIELGIWMAAIESFVGTSAHPFADRSNLRGNDWTGDLNLTLSGFTLCAGLLNRLTTTALANGVAAGLTIDELDSISDVIIDSLNVGLALERSKPVRFTEWRSWCRLVTASLHAAPSFEKAVRQAVRAGESCVPEKLKSLVERDSLTFADKFDLGIIVPGFARLLSWLGVVEEMLLADAPLKSSLLIFARVYEDTLDLIGHINRRLQRFSDEDAELFRALDSASYIASIELRKVFDQELAGLVAVRSAITVYARTETAFASLRDNIQQILAGIAKLIDPSVEPHDLFPGIGEKLDASLKLRSELASMVKMVRAAEDDIVSNAIPDTAMNEFVNGPVASLFYKDRESVERFVEEILRTNEKKDLVPILHRFGAYLETLFSHVNNRTVLREHPWES